MTNVFESDDINTMLEGALSLEINIDRCNRFYNWTRNSIRADDVKRWLNIESDVDIVEALTEDKFI